jgi:hypothetical protein
MQRWRYGSWEAKTGAKTWESRKAPLGLIGTFFYGYRRQPDGRLSRRRPGRGAASIAGEKGIELCLEAEDFRKALTSAGFDGGWKKTFGAEAPPAIC